MFKYINHINIPIHKNATGNKIITRYKVNIYVEAE